ncbi:helix-turn-helix domain-containing protein [Bacillaceae bacterium IKA-2]|nr:helix-turn-helix domain-containing protein [Bacillaceae bacterium IKA-2]
MTLGERLQNLRKENMLSQEKLAELVGVSRQAVSKWETGLSNPDTENLIKLGKIFNLSIDEIIGRVYVDNEVTDEMSDKINKKNLYILGAIIGFLAFAVSMTFVESNSLFVIVGIAGMVGMSYCISNIMEVH